MSQSHKDRLLLLGVEPIFVGNDFTLAMPYKPSNIGNPVLPALHGGAMGGFMEIAAVAEILLNYPVDCFAKAKIARHGRRIVNVSVDLWQDNPEKPIAALHGHFLIQQK